jgi:hypothetical protein
MLHSSNADWRLCWNRPIQVLFSGLFGLLLAGCSIGTLATEWEAPSPNQPLLFIVIVNDPLSLTDQVIVKRIEDKLVQRGFSKAPSQDTATVAVRYAYSTGPGAEIVIPHRYGKDIRPSYPRTFEISVIDIDKSNGSDDTKLIWKGKITSQGRIADMRLLAPRFIDVLFENYGRTVPRQSFWGRHND